MQFYPKFLVEDGHRFAPTQHKQWFGVEVRELKKGYRAAFAAEHIPKGSTIFQEGGTVLSSVADVPWEMAYPVLITDSLYLAPTDFNKPDAGCFLNHHCESNVARIGGLVTVAKKEIFPGTELTLDYATLIAGLDNWTLNCECGSPVCRKIIKGTDWQNPILARALWMEWLPHIQRKILNEPCIKI